MELYKKLLYFDIETAGKYPNLWSFKEADSRGADLFVKRCEKNKEKWMQTKGYPDKDCDEVYQEKVSLLPEYGQIVCASFAYYNNDELRKASYTGTEAEIVTKIIAILTNTNKLDLSLCGFNIRGFDNAWLIKKFFQHGFLIPSCLDLNKKPWELKIYDIAEIWRAGYFDYPTLDEVSWALGVESPKKILSGDKVHQAFWNGEIDRIQKYCEADVDCLIEIAKKIMR